MDHGGRIPLSFDLRNSDGCSEHGCGKSESSDDSEETHVVVEIVVRIYEESK
jgi:hypothetical protein